MDLVRLAWSCVVDPRATRWVCPLLLLADAGLCVLVVWKVAYTNIDWNAYMQQIALYLAGERDYTKLHGDTGPLVYPAMHVHIYHILHTLTSSGEDLRLAQAIFIGLYLSTLALAMQCYRQAGTPDRGVPAYVFVLLLLSKRVHSIFVLRLFNDCFAVFFLWLAICCYQRRWWTCGSLAFSLGLGVKMSLLLALPAVGMVLWQGMGRNRALGQAQVMLQVQVLSAYPFLAHNARSYLSRAFEFSRQFLFQWTVNWRFVGEEHFLSRPFSLALLTAHISWLILFGWTRWLQPSGLSPAAAMRELIHPSPKDAQTRTAHRITPDFILTSILSALLIGCLCARSLHYQFFVYIAWSTPFLLWRSGMHPVLMYAVCLAQEWAWNVYPSTPASSSTVVACMFVTVVSVWIGTGRRQAPGHAHTE